MQMGWFGGPRPSEQSLGEIKTLGQFGDLGPEGFDFVREGVRSGRHLCRIPAGQAATVDILELARGHENEVVEVPEPQPADGDEHEGGAFGPAHVKSVGAERAEDGCQGEGDAAGLFRGFRRGRIVGHRGSIFPDSGSVSTVTSAVPDVTGYWWQYTTTVRHPEVNMAKQRGEGVPALQNDEVTGMTEERLEQVIRESGRAPRKDAAREFYDAEEKQAGETSA